MMVIYLPLAVEMTIMKNKYHAKYEVQLKDPCL